MPSANLAKRAAYAREWRKKNPGYSTKYAKKWAAENPERQRAIQRKSQFKYQYGITVADYDAMYEAQVGCCAICGDAHNVLHVDHDHRINRVRGLLCGRCNRGIGMFKDNSATTRRAASYLDRFTEE